MSLTTKTTQGAIAVTGAFTSSITGLAANTTYYVNAYATNKAGTSYGTAVSFKTKIQLTITDPAISSRSYNGNTTATVSTLGTLSGIESGDVVSVIPTAVFDTKDAGTGKTVTISYVLSGENKDKYLTPVNTVLLTGEVTQVALTVTAADKSKAYDGSVFSPFTSTITGYVNNETIAVVTGTPTYTGTAVAAVDYGTYTITPVVTGLSATNYTFIPADGSLQIGKLALTITADAKSKVYGETNPALTLHYSGWQNGDDEAKLTTKPVASTLLDATSPVGVHANAITVAGGVDENYNFTYVAADFTVTQAMLTVTGALVTSKTYDGATAATITGAALAGVVGTDDVTLVNSTTGTFASANVGTAIPVSTSMTLTGTKSGNYLLTHPSLTGTITSKPIVITPVSGQSKVYGQSDPGFTYTASPNSYNLYPVPNDGEFTLSITTSDTQTFSVLIYNQLGSQIYELHDLVINGEFTRDINLRPASSGVYLIIIQSEKEKEVLKLNIVN